MKKNRQISTEKLQLPHPRDRKVRQLQRKEQRLRKLERRKEIQEDIRIQKALRFLWFRMQCLALKYEKVVPDDDIPILIELYIGRHEDELLQLKSLTNPPTGRIREIEAVFTEEREKFMNSGFEIPVLTDNNDFEILTEIWDGLPETASVIATEFVKGPSGGVNDVRKRELKNRLIPLDDVRMNATEVLPRRFSRKAVKNSNLRKEKKSVKKMDSVKEVQQRALAKGNAKSEMKRKQEVRAILAKYREEK